MGGGWGGWGSARHKGFAVSSAQALCSLICKLVSLFIHLVPVVCSDVLEAHDEAILLHLGKCRSVAPNERSVGPRRPRSGGGADGELGVRHDEDLFT